MNITVNLTPLTEGAFLEVCRRQGQTPEQIFEAVARQTIHAYLRFTAEDAAGMGPAREFRTDLFARFVAESGDWLTRWPCNDHNEPESFEAAVCQAKQHGRELSEDVLAFNDRVRKATKRNNGK